MNEAQAAGLANQHIEKILSHQTNVVSPHAFVDKETAQATAQALAAFRQTLIDELKKQP